MLAGLPVPDEAVEDLAGLVRATWPTGSSVLSALEDPPQELGELRAVLLADHQWRRSEGID